MREKDEIEELARAVHQLQQAVQRLETALPRNDLGLPDADGHRQYHTGKIQQAGEIKSYQTAVTQKILLGLVGVVMAALASGFWQQLAEKIKAVTP